jgi:hypothetical protein
MIGVWLALATGSGVVGAESLILPSVAQIAGPWQIESEQLPTAHCVFRLRQNDRGVLDPDHCLASILGFVATTWSVQPDGILLAGEAAAMPMLFSRRDAVRYSARNKAGTALWLRRTLPQ